MKKNTNFKSKHIKSNSFSLISFTNNFNKLNSIPNDNELNKNNKLFGKKSINLNKKNNLNKNNIIINKNDLININKNNDFNLPTYRKSSHQNYYKNKELKNENNEKNILFNNKFKEYKNIIEYLKKYSNKLRINNYLLYKNNYNNNIRICKSVKLNKNKIMKNFYYKNNIEINEQNFIHKSKSINNNNNNNILYNDFYNIYKSLDNNNINNNIFQNNIIIIQKNLRGFLLRKKFNNLLKKYFSVKIIFDYFINLFTENYNNIKKIFFSFLKFKDKTLNNKNSIKEKNKLSKSKIKKEDPKNNNNNHILKKFNSSISILKKPKLMKKKNTNNNNNELSLSENLIKNKLNKSKLNLNIINSNSTSLISINEEEPTHFTTEINNNENDSKNEYKKLYENLFQNYTKLIEINDNNNKKFKNLSVNKIKNFSCFSNNNKNKFKNLQICSNEINLINQNKNNFQNDNKIINNNFQIISIENFMIKNKKISNVNKYSNNKIMKIENKTFFILNWVKRSKREKSNIIFINKNKKDWIKLPFILEKTIKNYYRPFLLRILFKSFKQILHKKNKKILNSILLKFFYKNFHSDLLFNFNKFYLSVCYVSIKERFSSNQNNFIIISNNNFQILNNKKNIFLSINKLTSFEFNSLIEKRNKKLFFIINHSNNSLKKYFKKWIKINERKEKILKLKFRNKKNAFYNKNFNINNSLNKSISSFSSFQDYKILKTYNRFITDSNTSNHSSIFDMDKIIKLKNIILKFNNKNIKNKCFNIWKKKYKNLFQKKKFLKYFLMNLVVYFSNIETLINKLLHNQKYILGTYMFKWYFNIYYKNNK